MFGKPFWFSFYLRIVINKGCYEAHRHTSRIVWLCVPYHLNLDNLEIKIWINLKSYSEHSASVQAECLTKSHENLQTFPPNHSDSSSIHSKRFSVWHAGLAVRPKPIGTKASTAKRATSATAQAFATFYCIEVFFHTSHAVVILHPVMIHTILLADIKYRVSSFHRYKLDKKTKRWCTAHVQCNVRHNKSSQQILPEIARLRLRRPTEILADCRRIGSWTVIGVQGRTKNRFWSPKHQGSQQHFFMSSSVKQRSLSNTCYLLNIFIDGILWLSSYLPPFSGARTETSRGLASLGWRSLLLKKGGRDERLRYCITETYSKTTVSAGCKPCHTCKPSYAWRWWLIPLMNMLNLESASHQQPLPWNLLPPPARNKKLPHFSTKPSAVFRPLLESRRPNVTAKAAPPGVFEPVPGRDVFKNNLSIEKNPSPNRLYWQHTFAGAFASLSRPQF